jgi:hypothetical protein
MESRQSDVVNVPQEDDSVIQYDRAGREITRFASDDDCLKAMGIEEPVAMQPLGEEIREACGQRLRLISQRILGERSHAA